MKSFLFSILLLCLLGSTFALDPKHCRCRAQTGKRMIGGSQSRPWPWHVSVGWAPSKADRNKLETKLERHQCGGIILNENWVLTTGDCVYGWPLRPNHINIGYASNDLVDMIDQNKLVGVEKVVLHPDYNPSDYNANLALLKVWTPFRFNDNTLQPACLELDHPRTFYKDLVAIGFGVTSLSFIDKETSFEYGSNSRILKEALLKDGSGDLEICSGKNLDEFVCLSGDGSVCKGDEGGPAMKIVNGKATVVGIASHFGRTSVYTPPGYRWAVKPCTGAAAYSHLAAPRFIDWIAKTVGEYCH